MKKLYDAGILIRLTSYDLDRIRSAAEREGNANLSDYIRKMLAERATKVLQ